MFKKNILLLSVFALVMSFFLQSCGGFKVVEGNLDFLKGQKKLKLAYDYSQMGVGKFENEADYVAKKVKEYNEKEPGKGDNWAKAWKGDRATRFQPQFEMLLNKYLNKVSVDANPDYSDAKYTLILKTVFTEPGYNIYISRKNAHINVDVLFVETANPSKVLCKLQMDKIQGASFGGYDFDTGTRIMEAYAKCGKELAKFISGSF